MNTLPPPPAPDTHIFDEDAQKDCWSHSPGQMTAYGILCASARSVPAPIVVQPDGEWIWMTHPTRNDGMPMPVQKFTDDGVSFYRPFDFDATEFEWDARDDKWKVVEAVQPVQPTPLTDEQIAAINIDVGFTGFNHRFIQFVRAIELAHGISAPVVPTLSQGAQS